MRYNTINRSAKLHHRVLAVAFALTLFGTAAAVEAPIAAAGSACPSGYMCWYSGTYRNGQKFQFFDSNWDISGYGVVAQSDYNNSNMHNWSCNYKGVHWGGGTATWTANQTGSNSFSARAINSNLWKDPYVAC